MEVDSETKRAPDGSNFAEIYPLGLVPLVPERERAVILQYLCRSIAACFSCAAAVRANRQQQCGGVHLLHPIRFWARGAFC